MSVDWLIVGAGLTGAVLAERIATEWNESVVVADRRTHIGGNAFDAYNSEGILTHPYGPHIFHTNSERVWRHLSQFTEWRPYAHRVLAEVEGRLVPVPFNLDSLHALMPAMLARKLENRLLREFGHGARIPVLRLREHANADVRFLAEYIYQQVFEGYTKKQWGVGPELLDASVTARVPAVVSRDDRYFADRYQAMPRHGYTVMVQRILSHPRIKLLLNTERKEASELVSWRRLIYTGPIDEFFQYEYGPLPYRSLRFETRTEECDQAQPAAQINYPVGGDATRSTEFKQLTGQRCARTTVAYEYPQEYQAGVNEPYYPVPREANRHLYERYLALARREAPDVVFAGRLADYRYYNMDQAVGRALQVFEAMSAARKQAAA